MTRLSSAKLQNIRDGNHAQCYISVAEKAWKSVKWMTEKKAADAVKEFIRRKQT